MLTIAYTSLLEALRKKILVFIGIILYNFIIRLKINERGV